jgi:hypothetical protein
VIRAVPVGILRQVLLVIVGAEAYSCADITGLSRGGQSTGRVSVHVVVDPGGRPEAGFNHALILNSAGRLVPAAVLAATFKSNPRCGRLSSALRVVGVITIGADKPQKCAPKHPRLYVIVNGAPQQSDPDQIVCAIKET